MVRTNSGGYCDPLWRDTKTKAPAANLMRYICSHKTNNLVTLLITDSTDTRKRPGPPQKHLRPQRYLQPMTMCYELSNKTTPYQPNVDMSNFNAGHIPLPHLKRKAFGLRTSVYRSLVLSLGHSAFGLIGLRPKNKDLRPKTELH